jgi:acyl-coenzyme A thioesterase PaaI-like protein
MNDAPGPVLKTIPNNPPPGFKLIDVLNFNTHVGPLYFRRGEKGTPDEFVMGLRVQPYMCNPAGTLHGGMMMTVADLVGGMGAGILAGIRGKFLPTVNMTFDFVAPARAGDWVEGRA